MVGRHLFAYFVESQRQVSLSSALPSIHVSLSVWLRTEQSLPFPIYHHVVFAKNSMCLISFQEDQSKTKPARVRKVSRPRAHPLDRSSARPIGCGNLEERSPRGLTGSLPLKQSASIRPSLRAQETHASRSGSLSTPKPVLSSQHISKGSERQYSQSNRVSFQDNPYHDRLSRYVEVEYYASSGSSSSSTLRKNAEHHKAHQQGRAYEYKESKPPVLGHKQRGDQSRYSEVAPSNSRMRQDSHRAEQRRLADDYSRTSNHRKSTL